MNTYALIKLKNIFNEYDDKDYFLREFINYDLWRNNNDYVCYKEHGEYGTSITICEINGKIQYKLFVSNVVDENGNGYIETFLDQTGVGILTKYYSNRQEYYINNNYHSSHFNDEINDIIKSYTKMIFEDKKYPSLYKFIMEQNDDITLISKNEFI